MTLAQGCLNDFMNETSMSTGPHSVDEKSESTARLSPEGCETAQASKRRVKKIRWLSKLAGWSGHAALMSTYPEYTSASIH